MKKVYIASRVSKKNESKRLVALLEGRGYKSVAYWLDRENVKKPLSGNTESAKDIAVEALEAIAESDIFVMLSDKEGTGMYIELGAILSESLKRTGVQIFIVGDHGANSVFTYHPNIINLNTVEELFSKL